MKLSATALVLSSLGCERTVAGIKEDTREVSANADQTADQAKANLDDEVSAFKVETNAKLEQLSRSIAELEGKAGTGLDASRQKLKVELEETRAKLRELKAESEVDWQKAKSDLQRNLSELGNRMNNALEGVGDKVEKTLE